jgi:hypothetical protein
LIENCGQSGFDEDSHPAGAECAWRRNRLRGGRQNAVASRSWPTQHNTAIPALLVNHQGNIYEKDLGSRTASIASGMTSFTTHKWVPVRLGARNELGGGSHGNQPTRLEDRNTERITVGSDSGILRDRGAVTNISPAVATTVRALILFSAAPP